MGKQDFVLQKRLKIFGEKLISRARLVLICNLNLGNLSRLPVLGWGEVFCYSVSRSLVLKYSLVLKCSIQDCIEVRLKEEILTW